MRVARPRRAERVEQQRLGQRVRRVLGRADDVRDAVARVVGGLRVVMFRTVEWGRGRGDGVASTARRAWTSTRANNSTERVERRAVAAHQHKVLAQRPAHVGPAQVAHGVLHHMRHGMVGPRHAEAHRVRHAVGQQRPDLLISGIAPVRGAAEVPVGVACLQ